MLWFLYFVSTPFGKVFPKPAPRNSQDKNFPRLEANSYFTVLQRLVFMKKYAGKDESGSSNKNLRPSPKGTVPLPPENRKSNI